MYLLEWRDSQLRFRIKEIEGNLKTDLNLDEYDKFLGVIKFSDDRVLEINAEKEELSIVFNIYGEQTKGRSWSLSMDIWWIKWVKKIRFNPKTIKGKILSSIKMPNVM